MTSFPLFDFMADDRRANPPPSGAAFLAWMAEQGYDFTAFDETDWRGMGRELGMDDYELSDFLEAVASYME